MSEMTAAVLADRLYAPPAIDARARRAARTAALVVGGALLTAAAAQVSIPLGFTPVPITGQTFAVLLVGGSLGWKRGAASQFLYVALGAVGLPFYAPNAEGARGGWQLATGSTAGYLVGFVVAAAVVGWLAERGQDRRLDTSVPAMLAGSAVIYLFGLVWLAHSLGVDSSTAIEYGLTPFLIGDAIKLALAGALLPAAWRLTER
jgi:biotin transport system substrate-specific component